VQRCAEILRSAETTNDAVAGTEFVGIITALGQNYPFYASIRVDNYSGPKHWTRQDVLAENRGVLPLSFENAGDVARWVSNAVAIARPLLAIRQHQQHRLDEVLSAYEVAWLSSRGAICTMPDDKLAAHFGGPAGTRMDTARGIKELVEMSRPTLLAQSFFQNLDRVHTLADRLREALIALRDAKREFHSYHFGRLFALLVVGFVLGVALPLLWPLLPQARVRAILALPLMTGPLVVYAMIIWRLRPFVETGLR
jgi:hypothetical protein